MVKHACVVHSYMYGPNTTSERTHKHSQTFTQTRAMTVVQQIAA